MSTAIDPTQQPPPFPVIENQAYKPYSDHGSVGPVIGVLAVIMVLGVVAVMLGRLCSGRRVMGHFQYDFEGWAENKCSTCIDGRVGPPTRRATVPMVVVVESEAATTHVPAESPEVRADETPEVRAEEVAPHAEKVSNHQEEHIKHES